MRRLPPLNTLRVFEAAERHRSFKEAGDELGVTASAVSHRVATLEEELGMSLFVRHTRRIEPTLEGERLAAGVRRALTEIRRAVTSVDRRDGTRIRITGIASHLTRWLAPRLHRFRATHPSIELHISADLARVDLTKRTFDVALRFGSGAYPGVHVEYLMDDAIIPVASPRYVAEAGPIEKPPDILQLTRILDVTAENDDSGTNWRTWFAYHRLPTQAVDRGLQFHEAVIALEAAAGGLGVAVARKSLAVEEIRSGRLVQVLPGEIRTNWRHYALTLHDMADWPPLRAFVDWLRIEASDWQTCGNCLERLRG
jgi:LysR family glycine cleavage system transcriptional activator